MEIAPDKSRFIVEVSGRAFGVLVRTGNRYCFFASDRAAKRLDKSSFRSASEARVALAKVLDPARGAKGQGLPGAQGRSSSPSRSG